MSSPITYQFIPATAFNGKVELQICSFLDSSKAFNYFQSPYFFRVAQSSKQLTPCYIIAKQNEEIVGLILLVKQIQWRIPFLSFLTSRLLIWGGPVVRHNSPEIMEGLLQFYQKHHPGTVYTQIRNVATTANYKAQFKNHGFAYEEHLTIQIDLTQSEEELWKEVATKRRNQIRRAEKEGCLVEQQASLEALRSCYTILQQVYQRTKLPLPDFSHFAALLVHSDSRAGLRLFTVVWEGHIIGCMFCLAYGEWLFDYYAGSLSDYYKKYPNDLLPWAVLKWARKNGFTHFDFGGAGKPGIPYGVRDYKKQFGGQLINHGRYEISHFPLLYKAATLAIKLRRTVNLSR